jgi:hypothetical protein
VKPSTEYVVPYDIGVRWNPNNSDPLLVQQSDRAVLSVGPDPDDADDRLVHLRILGCHGVILTGPNGEAISGHRLWNVGLSDCLWAGEVLNSRWIQEQVRVNSIHPQHRSERFKDLRHWILLFKEATAECAGSSLVVHRAETELKVIGMD